jgi:preprotein translocase subunit SecY
MNPVGMVPIIFALAFASFPYLISQMLLRVNADSSRIVSMSKRIEIYFNIYTENPFWIAIIVYFVLIVLFTFFYTIIVFNPERIADTVQKR